eukprot:PhM_4_TR5144/c9_g1_i1/m.75509
MLWNEQQQQQQQLLTSFVSSPNEEDQNTRTQDKKKMYALLKYLHSAGQYNKLTGGLLFEQKKPSSSPVKQLVHENKKEENKMTTIATKATTTKTTTTGVYCDVMLMSEIERVINPSTQSVERANSMTSPRPRQLHSSTYDSVTHSLYIFGGRAISHKPHAPLFNDTWRFRLQTFTWEMLPTSRKLLAREGASLTHLSDHTLILFGGRGVQCKELNDVFVIDLGVQEPSWKRVYCHNCPKRRSRHFAEALPDSGVDLLIYGGESDGALLNDCHILLSKTVNVWREVVLSGPVGGGLENNFVMLSQRLVYAGATTAPSSSPSSPNHVQVFSVEIAQIRQRLNNDNDADADDESAVPNNTTIEWQLCTLTTTIRPRLRSKHCIFATSSNSFAIAGGVMKALATDVAIINHAFSSPSTTRRKLFEQTCDSVDVFDFTTAAWTLVSNQHQQQSKSTLPSSFLSRADHTIVSACGSAVGLALCFGGTPNIASADISVISTSSSTSSPVVLLRGIQESYKSGNSGHHFTITVEPFFKTFCSRDKKQYIHRADYVCPPIVEFELKAVLARARRRIAATVSPDLCTLCKACAAGVQYLPCGHITHCQECHQQHKNSNNNNNLSTFGRCEECDRRVHGTIGVLNNNNNNIMRYQRFQQQNQQNQQNQQQLQKVQPVLSRTSSSAMSTSRLLPPSSQRTTPMSSLLPTHQLAAPPPLLSRYMRVSSVTPARPRSSLWVSSPEIRVSYFSQQQQRQQNHYHQHQYLTRSASSVSLR